MGEQMFDRGKAMSSAAKIPAGEYSASANSYSAAQPSGTAGSVPVARDLVRLVAQGEADARVAITYDPVELATRLRIRRLNEI